ncbi:hypothetical protein [Subtercola sp. RTI3]|uniref:hypothetical protein n=1 Tax=Subtercola sp. RTI3 TaxID=3048639 RepID=UPI002B22D140|nr:hypothetical protein [Subtercola sp. RTI3]MEA9983688.1 hypothetical protein [Subtercola sp. RTI3]
MTGLFAGDLTENAVGAQITVIIPPAKQHGAATKRTGVLTRLTHRVDMVCAELDGKPLFLPRDKPITVSDLSLRNWMVVESDVDIRDRLLAEHVRIAPDGFEVSQ